MQVADAIAIVYLLIAWSWDLPASEPARILLTPLHSIVQRAGLWHSWRMFAPSPARRRTHLIVEAIVDGKRRLPWRLADQAKGGVLAYFARDRLRKFEDNAALQHNAALRDALIEYWLQHAWRPTSNRHEIELAVIEEFWPVSLRGKPPNFLEPPERRVLVSWSGKWTA